MSQDYTIGQVRHYVSFDDKTMIEVLKPAQVANELTYHESTIYQWCNSGKLIAYKIGDTWWIPRDAVETYKRFRDKDIVHNVSW